MIKPSLLAAVIAATFSAPVLAQDAEQPAYLVATLEVSDLNAYFATYGGPVFPMLAAAGAEVLVGTPTVNVLEGEFASSWTAIVRFPSIDSLNGWYTSAEYQAIAPARRTLSDPKTSVLLAAPGFVPPSQ